MKWTCRFLTTVLASALMMSSCATKVTVPDVPPFSEDDASKPENDPSAENPDEKTGVHTEDESAAKTGPHPVDFVHRGIKCELESMELENCMVVDDPTASGQKSVRMGTKSKAGVDINFPSGRFEILFSQKAYQTPGSRFYAIVDGKRYRCNPSEPPLGTWELTVRTPVVLELPEPATVSISIECDGSYAYSWDFFLDYMQAVKIGEIVQ